LGLKRLYTALDFPFAIQERSIDWSGSFAARFKAAMDEDFGTPDAVSVLFDLAAEINRTRSAEYAVLLKMLAGCLGLLQQNPRDFLQAGTALPDSEILEQIVRRAAAKEAKNFALADEIRKDLLAKGIVLKDSAGGTSWEAV
jgi:cysteinyl-tRNA synthetase